MLSDNAKPTEDFEQKNGMIRLTLYRIPLATVLRICQGDGWTRAEKRY